MKDFLNKYLNKENLGKVIDWCKKNRRFFIAAALFVVLLVVLYACTSPSAGMDGDVSGEDPLDAAFETDANEDVNALIASYFAAYADADIDTLSTLASPISENEKSYIKVFAQYIESYENITCYTKAGLTDDSYLVSAYFDLKFIGVETMAPGLDFFYVETAEDGTLFINNLYSSYNLNRTENDLDSNIYALILRYEQKEDSIALRESVEQAYEEARESDVELAAMISTTIPDAMAEWMNSINGTQTGEAAEESTEEVAEESTEETTEEIPEDAAEETAGDEDNTAGDTTEENTGNAEDTTGDTAEETAGGTEETAETPEATEKKVVKVKINVDKLKVRVEPNTSCDVLGKAKKGETYVELEDLGDWFEINFNGQTGYVKAEYVTEVTE